ncbi:MAG: hypothetical protein KC438_08250 [Thermomicrobiales bacterium]|nr:hypothetical protein [Thermomicrobiales bacterium]MCO5220435.1 hypothetical protein [Thermomicrobiales bacterium]
MTPAERRQPVNRLASSLANRRQILLGLGGLAGATLWPAWTTGQDATPAPAPMPPLVIPEIELVGTNDALIFPSAISAGINAITVRNESDTIMHTFAMRIPDGLTDDDAIAALMTEDTPDWFGHTLFAGNPDEPQPGGGELTGYVFYVPGHYMAVNPFSDGIATSFDVAGEPWGRPAPVADFEVGLIDMAFLGFDEPIPAGPHLWRLTNHGTTWHDLTTLKAPDGSTVDDLFAAFETTPEDQVFPDGYMTTGGVGATSPGVSTWVELNLEPGTHIAACFLPGEDGLPHAFNGMITAFEVV